MVVETKFYDILGVCELFGLPFCLYSVEAETYSLSRSALAVQTPS
jgi:hypothetical protein